MKISILAATVIASVQDCPMLPARSNPPLSVHDLRIDDIKVISAIGDSITAGFGARDGDPFKVLNEYRGISWAMGGDAGAVSIANMMKKYSPDLVGASLGEHLVNVCYGPLCPNFQYQAKKDQFNAARSGSLAMNLMDQAKYLNDQMRSDSRVNFQQDFKLLNFFIGGNDVCLGCLPILEDLVLSPDQFENTIRDVLSYVEENIPRVVVNLHSIFNVSQVYDLSHADPHCATLRKIGLKVECACALLFDGEVGVSNRLEMDDLVAGYNEKLSLIAADYSEKKSDSFMVSLNPIFRDVALRQWSIKELSKVDCFHPSQSAHELMAIGSWYIFKITTGTIYLSHLLTKVLSSRLVQDPCVHPQAQESWFSFSIRIYQSSFFLFLNRR